MIRKRQRFAYIMTSPAILILLALSIFPLIYTIRNSFTDYYLLSRAKPQVVGIAVFVNSFQRGKKILRTILLFPMLLPPVTVALMWQTMFSNNHGIFNEILGYFHLPPVNWLQDIKMALPSILIIDVWQYTPLAFLLVYASIQTVSDSQFEAAALDGAGEWKKFWYITLPNISAGVFMVVLLRIIDSFRLFDKVNILTKGGPANSTATITSYIYQYGTKNFKIGYASAASVIMTVIVVFLSIFYLKQSLKEVES